MMHSVVRRLACLNDYRTLNNSSSVQNVEFGIIGERFVPFPHAIAPLAPAAQIAGDRDRRMVA
jgi:hypothetical protein